MDNSSPSLMIIDDDPLCHFIGKRIAMTFRKEMKVLTFISPVEALNFIKDLDSLDAKPAPLAVFLDINMPEMNGWELLARLDSEDEKKRQLLKFYIVSSSVSKDDRKLAKASPWVSEFFAKPITKEVFEKVFGPMS